MDGATLEGTLDLGFAKAMQMLDSELRAQGVEARTREQIVTLCRLMLEFIPYAIAQGKDVTDAKAFADFATKRGLQQATLWGSDAVNCGVAITGFLGTAAKVRTAVARTGPGAVPLAVLAAGLLLLDLIEIGNSCPIVQQAWYEGIIRRESGSVETVRRLVRGRYGAMCRAPVAAPSRRASSPRLSRP